MITPALSHVKEWAEQGYTQCAVYRELAADLETPVSAFLKVAHGSYRFLLESVEGGEQLGRYSFIGTDPRLIIRGLGRQTVVETPDGKQTLHEDTTIIEQLEQQVIGAHDARPVSQPELPLFTGGAVGFMGYETVQLFERVPTPEQRTLNVVDSTWLIVDTILVFDHVRHSIKIIHTIRFDDAESIEDQYAQAEVAMQRYINRLLQPLTSDMLVGAVRAMEVQITESPIVESNMEQAQYTAMIERAREYIRAGDIFQVVLSQRFQRPTAAAPFSIYRALRTVNPSPYMFFIQLPEAAIVGASPEMLVRVEHGKIETHPIAGTRPRGQDSADEVRLETELLADEKERSEHLMLVDLGRNDVGRVSRPGTVEVPAFMVIERYSHVMHLVSRVIGTLDTERFTPLSALQSCFPAGTLSGAPKVRAMEIIAELEPDQRGPYGGCVGYVSYGGQALDTAITIRTMVLIDGVAYVQAGAGIVADSDPELEHLESRNKAGALLRALEIAEAFDHSVLAQ